MAKRSFKKLAEKLMEEHGTTDPFKIAEREGIQIIYLDFKAWLGLFSFVTAKRKPTNQNEPSIFLLRYDFVVVQRGRPIACLEYHHFAALKACAKSAKIS